MAGDLKTGSLHGDLASSGNDGFGEQSSQEKALTAAHTMPASALSKPTTRQ